MDINIPLVAKSLAIIARDISKNEISNNINFQIDRCFIKEIKKVKRPTMNITFSSKYCREQSRIKCKLKCTFVGRGNIPYQIVAEASMLGKFCKRDGRLCKTYTYLYLIGVLENSDTLLEIYPEDLSYPSSKDITGAIIVSDKCDEEDENSVIPINEHKKNKRRVHEWNSRNVTEDLNEVYNREIEKYNRRTV